MTEQEAIKDISENIKPYVGGKSLDMAIKALEEVQQYRVIGTPDECRAAVENQKAKKPILDAIYHMQYYCPVCQLCIARKNAQPKQYYCQWCGQKLYWGD